MTAEIERIDEAMADKIREKERNKIANSIKKVARRLLHAADADAVDGYVAASLIEVARVLEEVGADELAEQYHAGTGVHDDHKEVPTDDPQPLPNPKDVLERLQKAIVTASNDDISEPMTEKRKRHVERLDAMRDAVTILRAVSVEYE